ncbi:ABC-2 family transporter protein [bacterium BMS3Abin14]|nr:ABC-2 family transporter protein [bacterium BMS3Abin14]
MQNMLIIALKDYRDSRKNRLFFVLLGFLLLLTITSIVLASFDFRNKLAEYNQALQVLKNLGKVPDTSTPQFFPLKMLRGVVDYLEIIGAILGIILGYLSIAKEKGKNTLQLLLSRPIGQYDIVSGKVLGNSALILSVLAVNALALYLILWFVGGVQFSTAELVKLGLVFVASYFYIMFFFCLTSILALKLKSLPNALIIGFTIWLAFVLIIPQIGDTMDPDNQIPGGFFKSMKMNHDQGKEILKKFKTYETVRNTIEETSITKHYERLSFALLGIKDYYNNKTLGFIFHDKWFDGVWVAGFFLLALLAEYLVLARKEHILHNGSSRDSPGTIESVILLCIIDLIAAKPGDSDHSRRTAGQFGPILPDKKYMASALVACPSHRKVA